MYFQMILPTTFVLFQISFGSTRRIMTSWLDGFAKLHSFKMSGANILYR